MENVALWHERDISHSSVERMIGPDATVTLDFALARLAGVIDKLVVYPENMQKNLDRLGGLHNSQRVLLALTQAGASREDAYALVQRNAMKVWEDGRRLPRLLKADTDVTREGCRPKELEAMFDLGYHLKHVDTIFAACSASADTNLGFASQDFMAQWAPRLESLSRDRGVAQALPENVPKAIWQTLRTDFDLWRRLAVTVGALSAYWLSRSTPIYGCAKSTEFIIVSSAILAILAYGPLLRSFGPMVPIGGLNLIMAATVALTIVPLFCRPAFRSRWPLRI